MLNIQLLPFKTLTTQRLILREVTLDDAPEVFAFRSDKEAMRFIGRPVAKSIDEAKELIQKFIDAMNNNDGATWGITLKGESKVIGTIGFWRMQKEHYSSEIGYMLHPLYWGKGYAAEALEAVMEHGFRELKFHTVQAYLTPENTASSKLLERAGFVKEAHFRENYFFDGIFSDTAVYTKLNPFH
jgi:ribosomal-protein-alanine N-acetyltransferase